MQAPKVYTTEERTQAGIALYYDVEEGTFKFAREIAAGQADVELRLAIYWALNNKYVDMTDQLAAAALLFTKPIDVMIDDLKIKCRAHFAKGLMGTMSGEEIENLARMMFSTVSREPEEPYFLKHKRMQLELKTKQTQTRNAFNAQHKPAPEGTVKELAAKYGKSLSEIRRLKAAGELHTLDTDARKNEELP